MNSVFSRRRCGVLIAATLLCAVATVGCTTPRQYKINEAILIGERRQLEDEIYNLQFELRDALAENERLSARLEAESKGDSPKKGGANRARNATKAPGFEKPKTSTDENIYPGGDLLRTQPSSNDYSGRYPEYPTLDMNEVSNLPDFVAVPDRKRDAKVSAATPTASQAGYQPPRRSSGVSQVSYREAPSEEPFEEEGYDPSELAEENVDYDEEEECGEEEDYNEEDSPSYDYDYEDELPEDVASEWSPLPERR